MVRFHSGTRRLREADFQTLRGAPALLEADLQLREVILPLPEPDLQSRRRTPALHEGYLQLLEENLQLLQLPLPLLEGQLPVRQTLLQPLEVRFPLRPVFAVRIVSGQVFIDWNGGGLSDFLDIFQLQVNRGAGWVDLAYDTTPGYTDTNPLPTPPAVWKYRGQYRVGDDPVGMWSNEVSVTVGG